MKPTFSIENIEDIIIGALEDYVEDAPAVYEKIAPTICFGLASKLGLPDSQEEAPFVSSPEFETGVVMMERSALKSAIAEVLKVAKRMNVIQERA